MINSLTDNCFIFGIRDPKLINTVKWMDSDSPPTLPNNKFVEYLEARRREFKKIALRIQGKNLLNLYVPVFSGVFCCCCLRLAT